SSGGHLITVERILGGLEVVYAAVLLRETAVPVVAQPQSHIEVGAQLVFVLNVQPGLPSAIVAVRVSLKVRRGHEAVGSVGSDFAQQELREIHDADIAGACSPVARVQLRVGIAATEGDGVFTLCPDCGGRRHEPVLEYAGKGALRSRALPDGESSIRD